MPPVRRRNESDRRNVILIKLLKRMRGREWGMAALCTLLVLGQIVKEIQKIPDKWIPLILLPVGIAGAIALGGLNADSAIQGVLVTGAAVYGNQIVKQLHKSE